MGEVSQLAGQGLVDGSSANDEVAYVHQPVALLGHLQRVPHLQGDHGGEVKTGGER